MVYSVNFKELSYSTYTIAPFNTHLNHNCNRNMRDETRLLLKWHDLKCFGLQANLTGLDAQKSTVVAKV